MNNCTPFMKWTCRSLGVIVGLLVAGAGCTSDTETAALTSSAPPTAQGVAQTFLAECEPASTALARERVEAGFRNDDLIAGLDPDRELSDLMQEIRGNLAALAVAEGTPTATEDETSFAVTAPLPEACPEAILEVIDQTGASAAVVARINSTRAIDGQQTADTENWTLTWSFHPDSGLTLTGEEL